MSITLDTNDIVKLIPHRYPFLLVDKIVDFHEGDKLTAIKNVTINEPFFSGHFPERPVMPGVLIVEAMAQAGAILYFQTMKMRGEDSDKLLLFAGIDKARFKRVVEPGDQLRMEVKLIKSKGRIWKLEGEAYVDDQLACSAQIMSAQ
jgi:3-hydroxyacyl-[acyl-carrier-protein] dehydratase